MILEKEKKKKESAALPLLDADTIKPVEPNFLYFPKEAMEIMVVDTFDSCRQLPFDPVFITFSL